MFGNFQRSIQSQVVLGIAAVLLLAGSASMRKGLGQSSAGWIHEQHVETGWGMAVNPMYSVLSAASLTRAERLWARSEWDAGSSNLVFEGHAERLAFHPASAPNQKRMQGQTQFSRMVSDAVKTGITGACEYGEALEQDWRGQEDWRAFERFKWQGTWWMVLTDQGRQGRMSIDRGSSSYASERGYDQSTFSVSGSMSWPLYGRVRGNLRLSKVQQARTREVGRLECSLRHNQQNFSNWKAAEAPQAGQFRQREAVSLVFDPAGSNRMWLTTKASLGYRLPSIRMVESGVQGYWLSRSDEGHSAYNAEERGGLFWLKTEQPQWNLQTSLWYAECTLPHQQIATEEGWDVYAYQMTSWQGRAEYAIALDIHLFATWDVRCFRSDALPIGWYQRSDWESATVRIGMSWCHSNASRWHRKHAPTLRMKPEAIEFIG